MLQMLPLIAKAGALLTKIPFIGSVINFFRPNLRLLVEYALIALVLVIGGAMLHMWSVKNNLQKKNEELAVRMSTVELTNQLQEESLTTLREARSADNEAIKGLADDNKRLSDVHNKNLNRLRALEKQNASVRAYLDQRLPPELACVLNRTCAPTSDGTKDRSPAAGRVPH